MVQETSGGVFGKDILTRLGGLLIAPVMAGAIMMVHWPQWAFMASETHPMGGMEFQFAMMLTGLYFAIAGNSAAGE
ncbi:MAG TPA: hypothetical protein DGN59_06680 [Candidatus Latescibacteria bacterium]|nr:hypothetical protein [Candidatus Latescibacterota bacterium]